MVDEEVDIDHEEFSLCAKLGPHSFSGSSCR